MTIVSYFIPYSIWKKTIKSKRKNVFPLLYVFLSGSVFLILEILAWISNTELFSPYRRYEDFPSSWVINSLGVVFGVGLWFFVDKQIKKRLKI